MERTLMDNATERTAIRQPAGAHVFLWTAFPAGGALLGYVLARLPRWITALPWFPNQQNIAELAEVVGVKTTAALVVVGVLVGGFAALVLQHHFVTVAVDERTVAVQRGDGTTLFEGTDVVAAFVDGVHLVLLGPDGAELAREKTDLAPDRLRAAFEGHGRVWYERDPHGEEFTRWIDGSSDLSQDAHAILRARQAAIEAGDADDLRELRGELARHGVFVREQGTRQHWRAAR
ncbi:hypothetical protein AB0I60_03070 [Actinosynnema sp. NPDC050436]|uniref:YqeB family protein n=1 Tax=Actinosynnema sp. NPDC050436 TaxID=3155659 RepID=UPI0033EF0046